MPVLIADLPYFIVNTTYAGKTHTHMYPRYGLHDLQSRFQFYQFIYVVHTFLLLVKGLKMLCN